MNLVNIISAMQFRLFHNITSEREYHPIVFTPPRDDFGMLGAPRKFDEMPESEVAGDDSHATRQALCMIMRVICCFFATMMGIASFYLLESWIVGEATIFACGHQKILHGQILPGQEGDRPVVTCDKGYMVGAPVEFRCYKLSEDCVVTKKATVMREEVKKCWREYAFVTKKMGMEELLNITLNTTYMKQVHAKVARLVPNACLEDPSQKRRNVKSHLVDSTRLYRRHRTLPGHVLHKLPGIINTNGIIVATLIAMLALLIAASFSGRVFQNNGYSHPSVAAGSCPPSAVEDCAQLEEESGML